jgi:hypothetical protein
MSFSPAEFGKAAVEVLNSTMVSTSRRMNASASLSQSQVACQSLVIVITAKSFAPLGTHPHLTGDRGDMADAPACGGQCEGGGIRFVPHIRGDVMGGDVPRRPVEQAAPFADGRGP